MIIIKLWGGMGNQLFQYAFGYALSKNKEDTFCFDTSFYDNQPKYVGKRSYITKSKFPNIEINNSYNRSQLVSILDNRYIRNIVRIFTQLEFQTFKQNIVQEKKHTFCNNIPYSRNKENYYNGYWQSAKYFEEYRDEILKLFTPNKKIIQSVTNWRKSLNSNNCIAVHIRRGDYVRKGNKSITQDIEYYKKAIDYFNQYYKNALFCIFSDDIGWCKKHFFDLKNVVYVENKVENGDIIDLFSMSLCDHGIMSISTFSWWGNWLRKDNSNSLVIYPEGEYLNDKFMLDSWKCISELDAQ